MWYACRTGIPAQLCQKSIERSQTSKLHNWALIQFSVLHFPTFCIDSVWVELTSKAIASRFAEQFFFRLFKDARGAGPLAIHSNILDHTKEGFSPHPQINEPALLSEGATASAAINCSGPKENPGYTLEVPDHFESTHNFVLLIIPA